MSIFKNEFYAKNGFVKLYGEDCMSLFREGKEMDLPIAFDNAENVRHVICENTKRIAIIETSNR